MTTRHEAYQDIGLDDIDRAIYNWFDKTVDAHVKMPQEQRYKVPVILSTRERWLSSKEDRAHRDKDGRIVLPTISLTRTGLDPNNGMLALGSNVPRLQVARKVSSKTNTLVNNYKNRLLSYSEKKPVVYEVTTIPFPFNGTARFEFTIQTQYMSHMNSIIEKMLSELEFYDVPCFVAPLRGHGLPEGQGPGPGELDIVEDSPYEDRELPDYYYVCGYFDENIGSDGNLDEFTDQERVFRYSGAFTVPVYLQLDPHDKRQAVQVEQTAFQVNFGKESSYFPDSDEEVELLLSGKSIREKVRRR